MKKGMLIFLILLLFVLGCEKQYKDLSDTEFLDKYQIGEITKAQYDSIKIIEKSIADRKADIKEYYKWIESFKEILKYPVLSEEEKENIKEYIKSTEKLVDILYDLQEALIEKSEQLDKDIEKSLEHLSPLDKRIAKEWLKENPLGDKEFTSDDYKRLKKKLQN